MRPDFSRDVRCVLGLPFDAVTEQQAEQILRHAIKERVRCFLSTPNLNFAISCRDDAAFRQSVLHSDLSVADGWPIVAIARMIGAGIPERVTGSGLFERIAASELRPPVAVYFFGGPDGAAEAASKRLNTQSAGAVCVGFEAPGFGSVADMSTPSQLAKLNDAAADLVVVALGAKKGQAWIQHNLSRITAPVISHLGAVVNFAAGTVERAPRWVQRCRLEWLWRIKEEPALWRRYAGDGIAFARLFATQVVPCAIDQWFARRERQGAREARASIARNGQVLTLSMTGSWTVGNIATLRPLLEQACEANVAVVIELGRASRLDTAVIGSLLLLYGWQVNAGLGWRVPAPSLSAVRSLRLAGAHYLLTAV